MRQMQAQGEPVDTYFRLLIEVERFEQSRQTSGVDDLIGRVQRHDRRGVALTHHDAKATRSSGMRDGEAEQTPDRLFEPLAIDPGEARQRGELDGTRRARGSDFPYHVRD